MVTIIGWPGTFFIVPVDRMVDVIHIFDPLIRGQSLHLRVIVTGSLFKRHMKRTPEAQPHFPTFPHGDEIDVRPSWPSEI
jgi:hypothetical protein